MQMKTKAGIFLAALAVVGLLDAPKKQKKGPPMKLVLDLLPAMKAAKVKYPNVPLSLAAAICENESGGRLNAVRWECRNQETRKLFGQKTPCPGGCQRYDKKGRPIMSTGPWQFLIGTGEAFGLRATVDPSTDDRRDPNKSTMAAFRFLSGLLTKYKSKGEQYAIASYNAGSGAIDKAFPRIPNQDYVDHIKSKRAKYLHLDTNS